MPLLRLLFTALLALVAMGAALFAAIVVMLSALFAVFTGGKVRGRVAVNRRPGATSPNRAGPHMGGAKGEVIDIESSPVPEKKIE